MQTVNALLDRVVEGCVQGGDCDPVFELLVGYRVLCTIGGEQGLELF